MVAEIWALVISPFVDQWVALNVLEFCLASYVNTAPSHLYLSWEKLKNRDMCLDWIYFLIYLSLNCNTF